jgi:hypothetical protein
VLAVVLAIGAILPGIRVVDILVKFVVVIHMFCNEPQALLLFVSGYCFNQSANIVKINEIMKF